MPEITQSKPEPTSESAWVRRFAGLVAPGGTVLDLACGGGRHTRLFRRLGHPVTALDRDLSGVADLADTPGVELMNADLEGGGPWPLSGRTFDAVVVTNYLHRPLLHRLPDILAPGGVLMYETFAAGNEAHGKPRNPNFLLRPGELLNAVNGALTVVAFEHGAVSRPRAAVVQRICAVRDSTAAAALD